MTGRQPLAILLGLTLLLSASCTPLPGESYLDAHDGPEPDIPQEEIYPPTLDPIEDATARAVVGGMHTPSVMEQTVEDRMATWIARPTNTSWPDRPWLTPTSTITPTLTPTPH